MGETLETTMEVGASAVCPWDAPETAEPAAAVSVSVCPWETEDQLPVQSQVPTVGR